MTMPSIQESFAQVRHPHLRWWRRETGIEQVSREETLRARAAYWGMVADLDVMIGQILDALRQNHLSDNTMVVYSSDHGDMLGEHSLWWKHVFYEQSIKVPLLLSWPGVIPPGQQRAETISALDLTATILDALGAPALPTGKGRSLMGLLAGEDPRWQNRAFAEYSSDEYGPPGGCYQRMVRREEWKLIYYHGQAPQLFNLTEDPDERVDRAGDPGCQRIRTELTKQVLDGWDPERVRAQMAVKRSENQILRTWAKQTRPKEQYRWPLLPEMARLETE
jgi:choline-sulfatase